MTSLRRVSLPHLLTVVVLALSWFVATNHCALGLMRSATAESHARCCGSRVPAKQSPAPRAEACCQAIEGTLSVEKSGVTEQPRLVAAEWLIQLQEIVWAKVSLGPVWPAVDHDPPRVISFAEAVLQRSLLAHAPPSAV